MKEEGIRSPFRVRSQVVITMMIAEGFSSRINDVRNLCVCAWFDEVTVISFLQLRQVTPGRLEL